MVIGNDDKPYSSLDRSTAPQGGPFNDLYIDYGSYNGHTDKHLTPYACTFTLPDGCVLYNKKSKLNQIEEILRKYYLEYEYMVKLIYKWKNGVDKCMPRAHKIQRMLCFFEHTAQKRIHAHAIVFMDNNYCSGTSQLMSLTWARIAHASMKSMQKINNKGSLDKAFDRCNSVSAWLEYIQKEQTEKKVIENDHRWYYNESNLPSESSNDDILKHELE